MRAAHDPDTGLFRGSHQPGVARKALGGFFLSGLLISFLGAILPAWGYHIHPDFITIGNYFLFQNLGILVSAWFGARVVTKKGIAFGLSLGCALALTGFLVLAMSAPPAPALLRMAGLFLLGAGAGMLNVAAFHAITPAYEMDPSATLNLGGVLFGLGCLLSAVLVAGTFYVYTVASIIGIAALLPAIGLARFAGVKLPAEVPVQVPTWREAVSEFKSPAAILFALFLFFQFGNEWALAGWLALFLTLRLGISPATALFLLALYWTALLVGRVAAQWALPRFRHGRLLAGAVIAPLFAFLVLSSTDNLFGAIIGVLLAALGFSVSQPLVVEKIGNRFPYYHPGFFNGIFSIAMTGALLAPATLGYYAHFWGIGVVMGLPTLGTLMVLLLLLLILLEARLSGTPE
jgi:FHS family glucose/mannose:H+ symporter-like MFS transporter